MVGRSKQERKRIVVIGLGRFGGALAQILHRRGHDVLAIDTSEDIITAMRGNVSYAVVGDATNEDVLQELGVPGFDIGVVAIGADEKTSIMAALLLITMNLKMVVARAHSELHASTLERLGCHRVVRVEREMGERVADNLLKPNLPHVGVGRRNSIAAVNIGAAANGKSLLTFMESFLPSGGANGKSQTQDNFKALAIHREQGRGKDETIFDPPPDALLQEKDSVVFFGADELIERLSNLD